MIIRKEIHWAMGHALIHYEGACQRCHGHNWAAWFEYEGEVKDDGMVMDTGVFKKMQTWVDSKWDHKTLLHYEHPIFRPYREEGMLFSEEIKYLGFEPVGFNPTSENIAKFLHKVASDSLDLNPQRLSVTVIESPTINVTFKGTEL